MQYWWVCRSSTAIPPTPIYDVIGQHNNIEGITFRATVVDKLWVFYRFISRVSGNVGKED